MARSCLGATDMQSKSWQATTDGVPLTRPPRPAQRGILDSLPKNQDPLAEIAVYDTLAQERHGLERVRRPSVRRKIPQSQSSGDCSRKSRQRQRSRTLLRLTHPPPTHLLLSQSPRLSQQNAYSTATLASRLNGKFFQSTNT